MNEAELRAWHLAYETEIAEAILQARQMQRCATCRHWTDLYVAFPADAPDGWKVCSLASTSLGRPVNSDSRAFASDEDMTWAELITAPDFGCVQHEPKDDPS